MAVQLTFKKTEEILYLEDVLWGDSSTKIKFELSEREKQIFVRADWVDEEFKSSVEVDVAELLCRDINRDAGREVVTRTLNCIDAKDSHVYFKLFEFNNYTSIKVYERKFKVDMVK